MGTTTRRTFLTGGAASAGAAAAALLSGCSSSGSGGSSTSTASASAASSSASAAPTPSSSPSATTVALPATTPWRAASGEVSLQVKVRAVRLLEAIGSWAPGRGGVAAARARVAALGYDPALVASAGALLPDVHAATVQVADAQYGGILSASSSVLVVLRQWTLGATGSSETAVRAGGTTVDVRLVAATPHWRVTALYPARPAAPANPLPTEAAALLAQSRLHLPVAAHADIRSGTISAGTMSALAALAREYVLDVSVVRSGHPLYVFGTNRLSDHPRGHAFDIWAIDGRTVLDPANRALTERVMRRGIELGAWQVGGPVDLDAGGSQYFSDNTHHDHVHMSFRG